jgi:hypothetical protein
MTTPLHRMKGSFLRRDAEPGRSAVRGPAIQSAVTVNVTDLISTSPS